MSGFEGDQSSDAEGMLDEQPVAPTGMIPGPQMRMFAQEIQMGVVPVEGIGDCALVSFTAGNTTVDVFFPKSSAAGLGQQLIQMGTGVIIAGKDMMPKTPQPSPTKRRK